MTVLSGVSVCFLQLALALLSCMAKQGFSKCGLRASSFSITWELAKKENSGTHSRLTESETGIGWSNYVFNKPSRWLWCP